MSKAEFRRIIREELDRTRGDVYIDIKDFYRALEDFLRS